MDLAKNPTKYCISYVHFINLIPLHRTSIQLCDYNVANFTTSATVALSCSCNSSSGSCSCSFFYSSFSRSSFVFVKMGHKVINMHIKLNQVSEAQSFNCKADKG